jgi:hypothetical protein
MAQQPVREEYTQRLDRALQARRRLLRREQGVRGGQVASVLAGLPLLLALQTLHPLWLLAPAGVFVGLLVWQRRLRTALRRLGLLIEYYRRGLARLDGQWAGCGDATNLAPVGHPFAVDLDLFGVGSMFERLSTARTAAGARTLADWLLVPAGAEEVRRRHEAIDDLRQRFDLREELHLLAADVPTGIDLDGLIRWAN